MSAFEEFIRSELQRGPRLGSGLYDACKTRSVWWRMLLTHAAFYSRMAKLEDAGVVSAHVSIGGHRFYELRKAKSEMDAIKLIHHYASSRCGMPYAQRLRRMAVDKMRVAAHLAAIAAEAKLAEMKVRENRYWEGELDRDIASIERKVRELSQITERRLSRTGK